MLKNFFCSTKKNKKKNLIILNCYTTIFNCGNQIFLFILILIFQNIFIFQEIESLRIQTTKA